MKLVNGDKLKKTIRDQIVAETEWDADATEIPFGDIKEFMQKCTLSPAELAEILGGTAWVLKELKRELSLPWMGWSLSTCTSIQGLIKDLESQAPVSEPSLTNEDRRKAKAWDIANSEGFLNPVEIKRIDELLAQEKSKPCPVCAGLWWHGKNRKGEKR